MDPSLSGVGAYARSARADKDGSARTDKEGLRTGADAMLLVPDDALRDADPVRVLACLGVDADPLPLRHAEEVNGEIRVDEQVRPEVELCADPVPRVGGAQHARQRRDRLAFEERHAHPHPYRRGPWLGEGAARIAPLHRAEVALRRLDGHGRELERIARTG